MTSTLMGSLPATELGAPVHEGPPVLAVVLDHAHARLFLADQKHVREFPCLVSARMRGGRFHSDRQGSPGWGEGGFHGRRREEERRHYGAVARRLGVLAKAHGAQGIVLGGSDPVVAGLRRALPPRLTGLVIGTARLNPAELTAEQVMTSVRETQRASALVGTRQLLDSLMEGFGTGQAVDGLRSVLRALSQDQVRTLILGRRRGRPGYRCAASGRLVLLKAEAYGEAVVRVPDLVAAAVAETERLGGTVVEIRDPRQAERFDGVAALLRHR